MRPLLRLPVGPHEVTLLRRPPVPQAATDRCGFDGRGFLFLNRRHAFEGPDRWEPQGAERLWIYNLHYFKYLAALSDQEAWSLIEDWIGSNRAPSGPGWEPYPLSLRIREWLEWLLAHPDLAAERQRAVVESLAQQAMALRAQIEYDLMGNHLLENAVTLCWAGLSLHTDTSSEWVRKGLGILHEELERQVLADGTHDERSPMYQAILTEALLRLAEVAGCSGADQAREVRDLVGPRAAALHGSLPYLTHPDGQYALLNDAAMGVAPTVAVLSRRFSSQVRPNAQVSRWSLESSGYRGWSEPTGDYLVFDTGPIGPDHQPGHGHADTLSFEMSIKGRRVFTDTGVGTYEEGSARSYDRSTRAHNTIELDGADQAELWAAFRCGRRPVIEEAGQSGDAGRSEVHGAFRAAGPWRGPMRHRREVRHAGRDFLFTDAVRAEGRHSARLHLHVAPDLSVKKGAVGWGIYDGASPIATVTAEGFEWEASQSPYHPEFGKEIARPMLCAEISFHDALAARWAVRVP